MAAMVAAADMVAAVAPPAAALEASMSAALEVFVASAAAALEVSMYAALVSVYIADAHFLDAASAAVVVAVGAAELAGYGHPRGAGSTLAGPNLHRLVKKLASRPSQLHRQLLRVKNLTSRRSPSSR